MRRAVTQALGALASYRYGEETYDATKLGLGPLMIQDAAGFAGPLPIAVGRPFEASTPIAVAFPWAAQWSSSPTNKKDWSFYIENSTASATRRLVAYEFDRLTGTFTWKGFVTVTFPTATNHTSRSLRMSYEKHTAGTVSVSGTAVTGSGTSWKTDGACVGNRIGFGSTDPTQISTWYEISAIATDGSITLSASAGTVAGGTAFVIEDLRAVIETTNATATNGGVFLVKGLRWENFNSLDTSIPAATTVDNIRACYWLKSAATITETALAGCGLQAKTSFASQMLWAINGTTTWQLFKFNIRAALTLTSGADTTAFQYSSGTSATLTGTGSQANNGRIAAPAHGPGSGADCLYITTTTRVYRSKPVSGITTGDTAWLSGGDNMTEVAPGGGSTVAASSLMNSIEFMGTIDKFLIALNATTTPFRDYVTQYRTDGGQLDRQIGCDNRQINQSAADSGITPSLTRLGVAWSVWAEGGLCYFCALGTTAAANIILAVPLGADWEYADTTGCQVILPKMSTPEAAAFVGAYLNMEEVVGDATGKNLGTAPEPGRLYYRTAGIDDDSGSWTLLGGDGDMSGVAGAPEAQPMVRFRTMGLACVPGRALSIAFVFDDTNTDEHWQFASNVGSDVANKRFGFRHAVAYGSSVPRLKVELFDAESGSSLGSDDSTTQAWTWERSTNNGGAWSAWSDSDRSNADTYIRVTPTSLADNIKVRAVLRHY